MTEWTSVVITILSMSGLVGIFTKSMVTMINKSNQKNEALKSAVQAILKDRLHQMHNHFVKKQGATILQKEIFDNMFEQYKALGGNGVMVSLREEFMSLPTDQKGDQQ